MITVNKDTLANSLALIGGIVKKNPHIPILEHINIRVKGNEFRFRLSDAETQVQYKFIIEEEGDMDFCVPAHLFISTISRSPSKDIGIELKVRENNSKYVNIKAGKGRFKIEAIDSSDYIFNEVEIGESMTLTGDKLFPAFKRAFVACDPKDMRKNINGCGLFSYENEFHVTGSKQSMMSRQVIESENGIEPLLLSDRFSAFMGGLKYDGRISVFRNDNWFGIKFENYTITTKISTDKPLEQKGFFQAQKPENITVNRLDFEGAIKRVSGFTGDVVDHSILLDINEDEMVISASNNNLGHSASEAVSITCDKVEPMKMGINFNNVLNCIQNLESEYISLYIQSPNLPFYVQGVGEESKTQNWLLTTVSINK